MQEEQLNGTSRARGFACVILSAVLFGMMAFFAKIVYANGGNALSVVFYRFFLALAPAFICLRVKGISLELTGRTAFKILLMTVFGYGGTAFLLFISYNFIPTGMATTIHFTYPVFVILGSILFLKERAEPKKLLCVALCMGGILLFYNGESGGSIAGLLLAFASGITYAFYILYLGHGSLGELPTMKLIFYMNLFASVIMLAVAGVAGQLTIGLTAAGWGAMLFLSVVICLSAVLLFQTGVHSAGAQNAAILSTFEPITSLIMGAVFFHEALTIRSLAGSVLILISVVLVARNETEKTE